MSKILTDTIGNTDLVRLQKIGGGRIYVKLEKSNPAGSIKDRPAYHMLKTAIDRGELRPGMKIVEATSGNMGIALSMLGPSLGYKVVIVMPENMSLERRKLMHSYGADLLLTKAADGMQGANQKAEELAADPNYYMPRQFSNPANPDCHEQTTGPEIIRDLPDLAGFVAGVGTGGTVTGVGRALKKHNKKIAVWAMEPAESPLISEGKFGPHQIQGIGANFIPENLDLDVVDTCITVESAEGLKYARLLAKEEGLSVGISSGANVAAALKMAEQVSGKIVTVLPDAAERYLSTSLFEE